MKGRACTPSPAAAGAASVPTAASVPCTNTLENAAQGLLDELPEDLLVLVLSYVSCPLVLQVMSLMTAFRSYCLQSY